MKKMDEIQISNALSNTKYLAVIRKADFHMTTPFTKADKEKYIKQN